jgi:uncharacterized protein (DUF1330 family)
MSCYFIAHITIHDSGKYEKYLQGYDDVFEKYNGKVIAVDDSPTILEGDWPYTRTVVIRFPDEEELQRWYRSPEYQALARYRWQASQADIIVVKGRE